MKKSITLLSFLVFLLPACKRQPLGQEEYVSWVENKENGLNTSIEAGHFQFHLQYKPLEYIVVMNERTPSMNRELLEKNISEIKDMQYFTLRIGSKDGKTEMLRTGLRETNEYYQRIGYFSFPAKDDLCLIDGQDSLPCRLFHFERNYALTPYNTFLLAFPLTKKKKEKDASNDKILVYKDKMLNTGIISMTIKGSAISNIPELKL